MFNGTSFIAVPQGTTFTFSIANFDMTEITQTILIGAGTWKAISAITFTATYDNGPADSATVSIQGTNAPSVSNFSMDGPNYTTGDNPSAIGYPTGCPGTIYFRLSAAKGATNDTDDTDQTVTFNNFRAWGSLTSNTGLTSTDVGTLYSDNNDLTNVYYKTITGLTLNTGEYFGWAYRDELDDPPTVRCGTGGNTLTVAMDPADATNKTPATTQISSYTNANGFQENYRIIASKLTDITDHSTTITISTSTQVKNYFFWGVSSTDAPTESLVEGLSNVNSSYDGSTITGQTLSAISAFTNQYVYIAIPARHGVNGTDYQFKLNNFEFDVASPSTITITNPVGFEENYNVYRSTFLLTYANPISILIDTV